MARIIVAVALPAFVLGACTPSIALERRLAGVSLGDKASSVLKKYGNPDRIVIGTAAAPAAGFGGAPVGLGGGTMPPGEPGMGPMPVASPFAGLAPGALPGLSSVGGMPGTMPMVSPMSPMPGAPGSESGAAEPEDVRWTYLLPKGGPTIEVIVSEDVVAQITVSGRKWASARTAKGVTLGDNYKKVLITYGYPDKHEYAGNYLRVGYLQKSNIMFTLRDSKTVVGITIGLKE